MKGVKKYKYCGGVTIMCSRWLAPMWPTWGRKLDKYWLSGLFVLHNNLDFHKKHLTQVSKNVAASKARSGIRPSLFQELFNLSVDIFYKSIGKRKTWHGFHIFAIDGSKLQLPNSKINFEEFFEMYSSHHHERKLTIPLTSIPALWDLKIKLK